MTSLSFMIRYSTPSILTSVPDHFPNRMRSPTLTSSGDQLALLIATARTRANHFALRGLFLRGVRDDDAAGGFLLGIDALDDDAVVKRTKLHAVLLIY